MGSQAEGQTRIRGKRFLLSGQVQGVGCRAQVQTQARRLGGLVGFVRNLEDGRVEVCVRGEMSKLAEFEGILKEGLRFPVGVERMEVEPWSGEDGLTHFEVRRD